MFLHDSLFLYVNGTLMETAQDIQANFDGGSGNPMATLDREVAGVEIGPRALKLQFSFLVPNRRGKPSGFSINLGGKPPSPPKLPPFIELFREGITVPYGLTSAGDEDGAISCSGTGRVTNVSVGQRVGGHLEYKVSMTCSIDYTTDKTN